MDYHTINYEKTDHLAIITLNRPDTGNAIDVQMAGELAQVCGSIKEDEDIRVIVVTAAGRDVFSNGTDPSALDAGENRQAMITRLSTAAMLESIELPIIAAINGSALGQGLELVLACDFRFCSEQAQFGMPQVSRGEIPWDGGTQRLARIVGRGKAMEMILLGESLDATEALRIGLVNKVVPADELQNKTMDLARSIASKGPVALRYAKEAIYKGMDVTLEQGLRLEADLYYLLHTTNDRIEGIQAFQEKRSPKFEGK